MFPDIRYSRPLTKQHVLVGPIVSDGLVNPRTQAIPARAIVHPRNVGAAFVIFLPNNSNQIINALVVVASRDTGPSSMQEVVLLGRREQRYAQARTHDERDEKSSSRALWREMIVPQLQLHRLAVFRANLNFVPRVQARDSIIRIGPERKERLNLRLL